MAVRRLLSRRERPPIKSRLFIVSSAPLLAHFGVDRDRAMPLL